MTESVDPTPEPHAPLEAPAPPAAPPLPGNDDDTGWQPLPRAARAVQMVGGAIFGAVLGFAPWMLLVFRLDASLLVKFLALPAMVLATSAYGAWISHRRWQSTRWRLDARGLQVKRGRLFQREILVPRSRVQHLDLERGPIERRFGLATIVVHTAGSRLQAMRQSGLREADAVALRDALVPDADVDDDAV